MNCRQIDELLETRVARTGGPLPDEAVQHLGVCERCRSLHEFLAGSRFAERWEPSCSVQEKIKASLLGSLEPVSPLPPDRTLVAQLIGAFCLLSLPFMAMMGAPAVHLMSFSQAFGVAALIAAAVWLISVSLVRQMAPGARQQISPKALILLLLSALIFGALLLFPWKNAGGFAARGLPCLSKGLVLAVPAGTLFWWMVRRGAILSRELAGASIGLLAGLAGLAVLQYNCTIVESPHILFWHAGAVIASTLAGFLSGTIRRLAGPR